VDHAAVASARVEAACGFLFNEPYCGTGVAGLQRPGHAQADYPTADDQKIGCEVQCPSLVRLTPKARYLLATGPGRFAPACAEFNTRFGFVSFWLRHCKPLPLNGLHGSIYGISSAGIHRAKCPACAVAKKIQTMGAIIGRLREPHINLREPHINLREPHIN